MTRRRSRPLAAGAAEIPYETTPTSGAQRRLLAGAIAPTTARDDLASSAPGGEVEALAIVDASYTLRYTPGLLDERLRQLRLELDALLSGAGAFVDLDGDGNRWAPSLRLFYSRDPAAPEAAYAPNTSTCRRAASTPGGTKSRRVAYDEFQPAAGRDGTTQPATSRASKTTTACWRPGCSPTPTST